MAVTHSTVSTPVEMPNTTSPNATFGTVTSDDANVPEPVAALAKSTVSVTSHNSLKTPCNCLLPCCTVAI